MKKILVAVDESEPSHRAAAFVEEFFTGEDVSLTAVNVARRPIEWMPTTPYGGVVAWPYAVSGDRSVADEVMAREESAGEALLSSQVPPGTEIEVVFGETVDAILTAAEEVDADVIVVGSRDKNFMQRLLGGSVSEELVRKAPRPVLVVH